MDRGMVAQYQPYWVNLPAGQFLGKPFVLGASFVGRIVENNRGASRVTLFSLSPRQSVGLPAQRFRRPIGFWLSGRLRNYMNAYQPNPITGTTAK
jgi:hypothetical protein